MGPFRWDSCDTRICDSFLSFATEFANACSIFLAVPAINHDQDTACSFFVAGFARQIALIDFE